MPNIVIISFKYPPVYAGYGMQAYSLLQEISKINYGPYFTVLTWKFSKNLCKIDNSRVIKLGFLSTLKNSRLKSYIFALIVFFWLLKNKHDYTLIHSLSSGSISLFVILAAKLCNKKVMIKVTQNEMSKGKKGFFLSGLLKLIRQKLIGNADIFIAISREVFSELKRSGVVESKIILIPNGVQSKIFSPPKTEKEKNLCRQKLGIGIDTRVILFTGALNRRKGLDVLIEAFKTGGFKLPVLLLICGPDYGYGEELRVNMEVINGISGNLQIRYDGEVTNVNEYLKAADIFVLPSYSEGLPNSLLEAAMSGLPLVASDIGGNNEIVTDRVNGILFPVGDINSFRNAIDKLVYDQQKCNLYGMNAYIKAKQEYAIEVVAEKYICLYFKLLRQGE